MLPATRITKRSPSPWSKTISTGTRESEHPRMAANGSCPAVSSARRRGLMRDSELRVSSTKRRLPSRRRCRASRAGIIVLGLDRVADWERAFWGYPAARGNRRKITHSLSVPLYVERPGDVQDIDTQGDSHDQDH